MYSFKFKCRNLIILRECGIWKWVAEQRDEDPDWDILLQLNVQKINMI